MSMIERAVRLWRFRGIKVHGHEAMPTREVCETARAFCLPLLVDVAGKPSVIEMLASVFAQLGDPPRAAWLLGCAEALRDQAGMPRAVPDEDLLAEFTGAARAAVSAAEWDEQYQAGRAVTPAEAVAAAVAAGPSG